MRKPVLTFALTACLFLLIVGAKWAIFDRFGSPMPDWDQWDAEAVHLLIPWLDRDNVLRHLFHPHNEHRVILTKLQNLGLTLLNGQWDARLEAVTNAMLHAALAVAFWLLARRCVAARWHAFIFLLIVALFGLPFAWQNVLGGFHSQQYWLLLLSFAAIVLLPFARTWSAQWWVGVSSAGLALGSMGSGLLAAAVVLLMVTGRLAKREVTFRSAWPTLAVTSVSVAVGLLTRAEVAAHEDIKAKTAHDFLFSIVHSLEWPLREAHWAAVVLWLPWALLVWRVVRPARDGDATPLPPPLSAGGGEAKARSVRAGQTLAALGAWVLIQIGATAYARGVGADYPASRYMDTLAFGALTNGIALGWLLTPRSAPPATRYALHAVGLAWVVTLGTGLRTVSEISIRHELPDAKKYYLEAEGHMRRYLATNDPRELAYPDIPFPSADGLVERLAHPRLRDLMPVPIRPPLPMASEASEGFEKNNAITADWENPPRRGLSPQTAPLDHAPTWGSFSAAPREGQSAANWKSIPLVSPLAGWLKFETAGDLPPNGGGVRLALHDAETGELLAGVAPTRRPGDSWRAAYVRAPQVPFVVTASDASASEWLAFSPPVEMGKYSYWAWQVTRHSRLLLYGAGMAAVAIALLIGIDRRRQRPA